MNTTDLAAYAAAASAIIAAWQLYESRRESRNRTTFEHLREIESRVQVIRSLHLDDVKDEVKNAYETGGVLSAGALQYLALLDGLERLATARRVKVVNRRLVDEFLSPIVRRELVTSSLLAEIRKCWENPTIYGDLGSLLVELERPRRRALRHLQEQ